MTLTFNGDLNVDNFLEKYKHALDWLKKFGINIQNSRLANYRKEILKLQTTLNTGPVKQQNDLELAAENLLEALEVIDIWSALKNYTGDGLQARLMKAFYGTTYRKDEPKEGYNHRDFAFELWINARLIKAGFDVDLSIETDAKTKIKNDEIYIECKRPAGDNIGIVINKAFKQLSKSYILAPQNFQGYIAITVERFFNRQNKLVFMNSMQEVRELLEKTVQEFNKGYNFLWRKEEIYVNGVFVVMRSPFFVRESNSIIFGTWILITNARLLNDIEKNDLLFLGNSMNNAAKL